MKARELGNAIRANVQKVIVGKNDVIDLALVCLFCGGHLLIDDVPGTGKTKLAKSLAASLSCSFRRVQFTPDLLPGDITGVNYFDMRSNSFVFLPGPVFSNILLADEINRATPKTQSGLLECMEEKQVTVDGKTMVLEKPFLVIATQNPVENMGTFPLPEAELDRFLCRTSMGYPTHDETVSIVANSFAEPALSAVASKEDIAAAAKELDRVFVHRDLISYAVTIAESTRKAHEVLLGASPRAVIHLVKVAKGFALLDGRKFTLPEDIQKASPCVLAHRLILNSASRARANAGDEIINGIIERVPVPTEIPFDGGAY